MELLSASAYLYRVLQSGKFFLSKHRKKGLQFPHGTTAEHLLWKRPIRAFVVRQPALRNSQCMPMMTRPRCLEPRHRSPKVPNADTANCHFHRRKVHHHKATQIQIPKLVYSMDLPINRHPTGARKLPSVESTIFESI